MYLAAIQQFAKTLSNLDKILEKSINYAETRKFNPDNFVNARLFPDMLPFSKQIMIASDVAKGCAATLTKREAPKFEDNETTMEQLRERIRKTIAYLGDFSAKDFENVNEKEVYRMPYPAGKGMLPQAALITRAIPNFFFHVSMAYALLRQGGVDIGKSDYLGDMQLFDMP